MLFKILLLTHVCAATIGLLSGFLSMAFRKGSGLHRAAGNVFFVSMLIMSASAAYIAAFLKPIAINVVASLLTLYLVSTAWRAGRRRVMGTTAFDRGALLLVVAIAAGALLYGLDVARTPSGSRSGIPAAVYFVFGSVAVLCARSDIRMLRRGGVEGRGRIARHLVRMCLALLIATLSFYPGQAKLFSRALRDTSLLFVPHVLLVGSMLFWSVRMRSRGSAQERVVSSSGSGEVARADIAAA